MYTKEQASQLRQAFWTAFGQYMALHPSVEGIKTNWINYNTGFKHLFFKMHAGKKNASTGIEMSHPDTELQEMFFDQFKAQKQLLHQYLGEEWIWELHTVDDHGKVISKIYKELAGVNVFNQDDWPAIISFLKPRIIALDEFWNDAQYSFAGLL